jgi:hypothetical protein
LSLAESETECSESARAICYIFELKEINKMDIFDFEELTADMLNVTDRQREDDDYLPDKFYDKFDIEFDLAFQFAQHLILHTVPVEAGLSGKKYHAFVSKKAPCMLMKTEAN